MATSVTIGYGTKYEITDTSVSPDAFVSVGELLSVDLGEDNVELIDATHMDSPNRRREFVAGLIDGGEASIEINWVPSNTIDTLIRTIMTSGDTVDHRITLPNNERVTFPAIITGYQRSSPLDDKMTATLTVKKAGDETWDTAS